MKRPRGYYESNAFDWEPIKQAFLDGDSQADIARKYNIPKTTLNNNVKSKEWIKERKANEALKGFNRASEKLSLSVDSLEDGEFKDSLVKKVNTILEDNTIQTHNRSIALKLQSEISSLIDRLGHAVDDDGVVVGMSAFDVQKLTSSIASLEKIANPTPNTKVDVNTEVNVDVVNRIEVVFI